MDAQYQATIGRVSNPNHGAHIINIYIYIYIYTHTYKKCSLLCLRVRKYIRTEWNWKEYMDSWCQATIGWVFNPNHGTRIIYIYIYIYWCGGWGGDCGCLIVYVRISFDPWKKKNA